MADPKLQVQITTNMAGVERDFGKVSDMARNTAKRIEGSFGALGGSLKASFAGMSASLSAGAFVGIVKQAVDFQDKLNDLSKTTAISIENLAGLSLAAEQSGTDLDGVAKAVSKLSTEIGKRGEEFGKIGVTSKEPIEAFKQMADVIAGLEDPYERARVAQSAFGKSWQDIMPLLAEGGKNIGTMTDKGKELSRVTAESAAKASELDDHFKLMAAYAKNAGIAIANPLISSLIETARVMDDVIKNGNIMNQLLGSIGRQRISFDAAQFGTPAHIKELQSSLEEVGKQQEFMQKNRFWATDPESVKTMDELTQKATVLKNQIAALEKFGERKTAAPVETVGVKVDTRGFGATVSSVGTKGGRAKAASSEDRLGAFIDDLDVKQLQEYESALESFSKLTRNAAVANADLTDSQKQYYDLINSSDWGKFSDQQQLQIRQAFEMADAAEIEAEATKKILESLNSVADDGKDKFGELQQAIEGWGKSSAKAIADFAVTGKASFSDMTQSIVADLIEMAAYQNITKPLFEGAGNFFSGLFPNAKGGVYSSPSLSAYSGGVYDSPRVFAFARGAGVFGEAGPEAIMPLSRDSSGKLGVKAQGAGGVTVNVINNAAGTQATQQTRQDAGGKTIVDVVIEQVKNAMIGDIGKGGTLAGALESQYALNRSAGAWR